MDRSANSSAGSLSGAQQRSGLPETSRVPSSISIDTQSKQSSHNSSLTPSPYNSRDSSPTRNYQARPSSTAARAIAGAARSRRNSQQDTSPSRTPKSNLPVPPAPTKPLSTSNTPTLLPAHSDHGKQTPGPQKSPSVNTEVSQAKDSPRWPVSPRLRSPPPQLNRPGPSSRRVDTDPPRISLHRASPSPGPDGNSESDTEDSLTQSGVRTPAMGGGATLETVQEVSQPNSPGQVDAAALEHVNEKLAGSGPRGSTVSADNKILAGARTARDSGSESGGGGSTQIETRRSQSAAPHPSLARQSSAFSAKQGKGKTASGEGSSQTMTVETETVSSIPQVALAPSNNKADATNGTLKTKPSTETIKPRKDKKKTSRKQPAVAQGPASSKADIFEAKVASAVDEADTSDSEETFVYDSNPPDGGDRPRRFHHSRTPSATSMASQADRNAMRSIHTVMENSANAATARKGMKFVNTFSGGEGLTSADDDGKGSSRSVGPGSGRGTARHHHHNNHLSHIGRWGRGGNNNHTSLFDNESPFPNAANGTRSKFSGNNSRHSSGPPSPRHANGARIGAGASGKKSSLQEQAYDLGDTTGADDERTPLIASSMRSSRNRNRRNPRQLESQSYRQKPSYLNRFAACLVVTMMLLLVITAAIGFMFATSQPLTDIKLVSIKNVLASDPELMFDMTVKAHNPNIVLVTIDQANIEVFAKSIHAGTDSDWWKMPKGPDDPYGHDDSDIHIEDDPPDDPPDDNAAPNMRLGAITVFDSPLSFEGSFFNKGVSSSTGELRLALPGNHTAGGSERWGRIIQDEFDLVLKGVVRYSLPLSQRVRSAPISGRATVKPNSASDPSQNSTTVWEIDEDLA